MSIKSFEDILAWQKSHELSLEVYRSFTGCKDFSFRDQIQRASVSIMNNIAEGYERNGNKEFRNFLYIAKGSCAEIRSMLSLAVEPAGARGLAATGYSRLVGLSCYTATNWEFDS